MNHREVCERFIDYNVYGRGKGKATGHNVFFRGSTLYSHGEHFPLAWCIDLPDGLPFVLVNADRYSVSTAKHQSHLIGALIDVGAGYKEGVLWAYVDGLRGVKSGNEICDNPEPELIRAAMQHYDAMLTESIAKGAKARTRKEAWATRQAYAAKIIQRLNAILESF